MGGDIYLYNQNLNENPYLLANSVKCNGMIFTNNFSFITTETSAGEGISVEYDGPVTLENSDN